MKIKFSVFGLITGISFMLAFVCILMYYVTPIMYYPAMALFFAAFVMLSIILFKRYMSQTHITQEKQDAIIMELAQGPDGEKYVVQDPKKQKKIVKQYKREKFENMLPALLCVAFACLFLYMFVASIIKLF